MDKEKSYELHRQVHEETGEALAKAFDMNKYLMYGVSCLVLNKYEKEGKKCDCKSTHIQAVEPEHDDHFVDYGGYAEKKKTYSIIPSENCKAEMIVELKKWFSNVMRQIESVYSDTDCDEERQIIKGYIQDLSKKYL